jgi:hypothetical protein
MDNALIVNEWLEGLWNKEIVACCKAQQSPNWLGKIEEKQINEAALHTNQITSTKHAMIDAR